MFFQTAVAVHCDELFLVPFELLAQVHRYEQELNTGSGGRHCTALQFHQDLVVSGGAC